MFRGGGNTLGTGDGSVSSNSPAYAPFFNLLTKPPDKVQGAASAFQYCPSQIPENEAGTYAPNVKA